MDSKEYLISYGWKEGEAFKEGGLKRPILVKHKRDKKGLGNAPGGNDGEAWWERLFDGHLKNLDVSTSNGGIKFTQNEVVASAVSKSSSPLYRWFVKGEGLKGTIGNHSVKKEASIVISGASSSKSKKKRSRGDDDDCKAKKKKLKKDRKSKDDMKSEKERKTKKDSKKAKKSKHSSNEDKKSKHKKDRKIKKHKKEQKSAGKHKKEHIS
ncbi:hypothetical protein SUVZ_13G3990 [Saccharomyces uvarum]|uniref:Tma23p n=1 Tax=Saccharomyces uvarum TaxID=230603 RepID=A0ABN8WJP5_SACUV|nr:hypothetical protein SUVZ_13G3990 [Saccharomyces uvarum]